MKKAIKIIVPVALVLIAAVCLFAGLTHGKNWSKGTLLKTEKGVVFWIDEHGSPIELSFMNDLALKAADKYATGDGIVLLHDMILESYPARTGCYFLMKSGSGKEIPADTLSTLASMGWIDAADAGEEGLSAPPVDDTALSALAEDPLSGGICEFALKTFRELYSEKGNGNALFSPLSLYTVLALTAEGAAGDTRAQLDALLGGDTAQRGALINVLNGLLAAGGEVKLANGVWINDACLIPDDGFVSRAKSDHGAEVFFSGLDDNAVPEINAWTAEKTDGRIPELIETLDKDTLLVLVNALAFGAPWQQKYTASDVRDGTFTAADGTRQEIQMMCSSESQYLETETATGFVKPYANERYAFAALLPNEGTSAEAVLGSLTGEALRALLQRPQAQTVVTGMPKFSMSDETELIDPLKTLGVQLLFDANNADLSGFGTLLPPYAALAVSRVMQKCVLDVTADGTSGAAATVETVTGAPAMPQIKTVTLDRPFVFVIFETGTGIPLFMGVLNSAL